MKGYRKYSVDDTFLEAVGPEQAYFVGLMAADGSISKSAKAKTNQFRYFRLSQSGENGLKTIKYITTLIDSNCKVYADPKVNSYSFQITSVQITAKLIELGVTPNKTLTLKWPELNPKLYSHFLRGYFDGDGSVGIYKRGAGTYLAASYVGTEEFIKESIKHIPVKKFSVSHIKRCKNLYQVSLNGQYAENFCKWLWNESSFQSYKFDIYQDWMDNYDPPYRRYAVLKSQAFLMRSDGVAVTEISEELEVPFQTIYRWFSSENISFRPSPAR